MGDTLNLLDLDPGVKRKAAVLKELPPVHATGWKPPDSFPDLRSACLLSFDTETKDPGLVDHGPGWARKQGHIVGISIAARALSGEEWCGYFPIRHEVYKHQNCDPANVLAWAKDMLETPIPKTGANLMYDVGWLAEEQITVQGPLYDIQYAEALLDEQGKTNLEFLGRKYLGEGKSSSGLYDWCSRAYGGAATGKQRANIYRTPPEMVGFYGESDASLPLRILPLQWAELVKQDLIDLYIMECKLTRLLIKMRQTGVRVDTRYAHELYEELGGNIRELQARFEASYSTRANYNSGAQLGPLFEAQGIKVPRTEAGAYSIQKVWLESIKDESPIASDILQLREFDKLQSTFVRGYILDGNVNGRLHCSFNPLRTDKGGGQDGSQGAKTGRFSSSDPNLQNIPARSKIGKRVRKAFVPDEGHIGWVKFDYSQIEYRMLAHFATDEGDGSAARLRDHYNSDPNADYHDVVYDNVCPYMGWDPTDSQFRKDKRRPIKNVNFGLVYGQGLAKLSKALNLPMDQAKAFLEGYFGGATYVKPTMNAAVAEVDQHGFVRTILNRRTRFDLWQPDQGRFSKEELPEPIGYEAAIAKWGSNIRRAYGYRAINYKLQGSAADMMKKAMVDLDESGVFDYLGVPKLTVHDELDFSLRDGRKQTREALRYVKHRMETALSLRVPVVTDPDFGKNWGECG